MVGSDSFWILNSWSRIRLWLRQCKRLLSLIYYYEGCGSALILAEPDPDVFLDVDPDPDVFLDVDPDPDVFSRCGSGSRCFSRRGSGSSCYSNADLDPDPT